MWFTLIFSVTLFVKNTGLKPLRLVSGSTHESWSTVYVRAFMCVLFVSCMFVLRSLYLSLLLGLWLLVPAILRVPWGSGPSYSLLYFQHLVQVMCKQKGSRNCKQKLATRQIMSRNKEGSRNYDPWEREELL